MKNYFRILVIIIPFFYLSSCKHEQKEEAPPQFLATKPILKDTTLYAEYVCQIHAYQHIELRALEKGYLSKIYIDEGQRVSAGQLLFQIKPLVYQADKEIAQSEVGLANIEYQNTKSLADSNIVSPSELSMSKAKLNKARAILSLAQAHLSFTTIKAPFSGIIDKFRVRLGSLVDEGDLLTLLSDNSKMWVYFNIPEADYLDYMTKGSEKNVKVKLQMANNEIFNQEGVIETIEADFNNETGNIALRATFPNPMKILRHGETGNILMPKVIHNALLIPQEATYEILDRRYVFVVGKDKKIKATEVKVGAELPHMFVVTSGLKPDDIILVEGLRKVSSGDKVNYKLEDMNTIIKNLSDLHAE